ncbi:hypothetical protein R1flu_010635 [Riccia fluitans]|uniref:Uncharacterized protein n=1 Tax=Riccia fluitans TaxID=41844 RepID=A0ABD1Z5J0_9MARC
MLHRGETSSTIGDFTIRNSKSNKEGAKTRRDRSARTHRNLIDGIGETIRRESSDTIKSIAHSCHPHTTNMEHRQCTRAMKQLERVPPPNPNMQHETTVHLTDSPESHRTRSTCSIHNVHDEERVPPSNPIPHDHRQFPRSNRR